MAARDPGNPKGRPGDKGGRAERLAAALKQNLRRRKAQARGRAAGGHEEGPAVPPGEAGGNEKDGQNQ